MWICKTCNKELDEWVKKCETCNISRNSNDLIPESQTEEKSEEINNTELKFSTLRSYAKIIVSIGYILAGLEILFSIFALNTFYNIDGVVVMFLVMVTAISVALTIIMFTIIGHLILVFLDIEENTRHTSNKLDKLFLIIEKVKPNKEN